MKRKILTLILLISAMLIFLLTGCGETPELPDEQTLTKEFNLIKMAECNLDKCATDSALDFYGENNCDFYWFSAQPGTEVFGPYYEITNGEKANLRCTFVYPKVERIHWKVLHIQAEYAESKTPQYKHMATVNVQYEIVCQSNANVKGYSLYGEFPLNITKDVPGQVQGGVHAITQLHPGKGYDYLKIVTKLPPGTTETKNERYTLGFNPQTNRWENPDEKVRAMAKVTVKKADWLSKEKMTDNLATRLDELQLSVLRKDSFAQVPVAKKILANNGNKYVLPFHYDYLKITGMEPLIQSMNLAKVEYAVPWSGPNRNQHLDELLKAIAENPLAHEKIRNLVRAHVDDILYDELKSVKNRKDKERIDAIIASLPWKIKRLNKLSATREKNLVSLYCAEIREKIKGTKSIEELEKLYPALAEISKYPKEYNSLQQDFALRRTMLGQPKNSTRLVQLKKLSQLLTDFDLKKIEEIDATAEKSFNFEDNPEFTCAYGDMMCLLAEKSPEAKQICEKRKFILSEDFGTEDTSKEQQQQNRETELRNTLLDLIKFEISRIDNAEKK